jgi:hypothetical protein
MGYTHYWTIARPFDNAFAEFSEDCVLIIGTAMDAGIKIGDGFGKNLPTTTATEVIFNGVGKDSHETFHMNSTDTGFAFCKTVGKPYDTVVCAILIRAKFHFGDAIEISSDGDWNDWKPAQLLYETVFDIQPNSVLSVHV